MNKTMESRWRVNNLGGGVRWSSVFCHVFSIRRLLSRASVLRLQKIPFHSYPTPITYMYKSGERVHNRQQIKTAVETANCIAKKEPVIVRLYYFPPSWSLN